MNLIGVFNLRSVALYIIIHSTLFLYVLFLSNVASVRGSTNGTIGNFTNGTIGSQWYHWLTNVTNGTIWRANGTLAFPFVPMVLPMVPLEEP